LAAVYIELLGGTATGFVAGIRQPDSKLPIRARPNRIDLDPSFHLDAKSMRPIRAHAPTAEELKAHAKFLTRAKKPDLAK
jgi:hypothetical protein